MCLGAEEWADWVQEEGGITLLGDLNQILIPLLASLALHQVTQICTSDFIGADPSSCTGVAAIQHQLSISSWLACTSTG